MLQAGELTLSPPPLGALVTADVGSRLALHSCLGDWAECCDKMTGRHLVTSALASTEFASLVHALAMQALFEISFAMFCGESCHSISTHWPTPTTCVTSGHPLAVNGPALYSHHTSHLLCSVLQSLHLLSLAQLNGTIDCIGDVHVQLHAHTLSVSQRKATAAIHNTTCSTLVDNM